MLIVDLIAAAMIAGLVVLGLRRGLAGTLTLAAFAVGAVIGAVLGPLPLRDDRVDDFALVLALPAALLLGGLLAAVVERRSRLLRRRLARRGGAVDTVGGGLLGAWAGVAAVWLIGTAVAQFNALRDPVEGSTIVSRLDGVLAPPDPGTTERKRPFDPFPIITGPVPVIPPVQRGTVKDPQIAIADRSVAKIGVLTACGGGTGSGWVAADGIVVTNAHVAAAADAMTVRIGGKGPGHPGTPIWFDPVNDIALLRVPGLRGVPALPIVSRPKFGTKGATLGFPRGNHSIRPARLGPTTDRIRGRMAMDRLSKQFPRSLIGRLITLVRANTQPGSSGGPVVDERGRVLATIFGGGGIRDRSLAVPNRFVRSALRRAGPPVDTGTCPER